MISICLFLPLFSRRRCHFSLRRILSVCCSVFIYPESGNFNGNRDQCQSLCKILVSACLVVYNCTISFTLCYRQLSPYTLSRGTWPIILIHVSIQVNVPFSEGTDEAACLAWRLWICNLAVLASYYTVSRCGRAVSFTVIVASCIAWTAALLTGVSDHLRAVGWVSSSVHACPPGHCLR